MAPPQEAPQENEDKPGELTSFPVLGVNTQKLLERIKEEGEHVWYDEYNAH